jgi:ketosteroid isomerase-like protein
MSGIAGMAFVYRPATDQPNQRHKTQLARHYETGSDLQSFIKEETAMSTDDKTAVLAANEAWYAALNAMLNGNPAPFADVYSHADDVSYMSAEGGLRIGWDATWSDWQAQARLARGGHVEEIENNVIVNGDMAVVQTHEKGIVNNPGGAGVEQEVRETSVFRREDGNWKMVAHHADLLPNWIEVAGTARDA